MGTSERDGTRIAVLVHRTKAVVKREVLTCDVCDRELPLRGVKGQVTREVTKTWHWPGFRPKPWEPDHICEDCWGRMVEVALAARKEADLAV